LGKIVSSLKRNYFFSIMYQVLSVITPLITAPYVSRVLGAAGIGQYSYTQSIVIYFSLIASLGSGVYGLRGIAAKREDKNELSKFFWEIFLLRVSSTIVCLFIYSTTILQFYKQYKVLFLIQTLDLIAIAVDISWFYQGLENFKKTVTRQILIKILSVVAVLMFVKKSSDVPTFVMCYSLPILIGNLILWPGVEKELKIVSLKILKTINPFVHLKGVSELSVPCIAILLFSYIDKVMIGSITGTIAENGYYEQAMKIIYLGINIITALSTVLMPRIALCYHKGEKAKVCNYLLKCSKIIFLLGGFIGAGVFAVSSNFVPWFLGDSFLKSVLIMKLLSPLIIMKGMETLLGNAYLIASFQQNKYSISIWIGAGLNVAVNALLIPRFQSVGACIASLISEMVFLWLMLHFSKNVLQMGALFKEVAKYVLASVVAIVSLTPLSMYLAASIFHSMILIILLIVVYCGVLAVLRDEFYLKTAQSVLDKGKMILKRF
jgi:O-antigen/teichoic acid export membrane protein